MAAETGDQTDTARQSTSRVLLVLEQVSDFLSWWIGTLVSMLPDSVISAFLPAPPRFRLWEEDGNYVIKETGQSARRLSEEEDPPGPVFILLDRDDAIIRNRTLPRANLKRLRDMARLQIIADSPFDPGEIRFDLRIVDERTGRRDIVVEIALVKQALINRHLKAVREMGLTVAGIDIRDVEGRPSGMNLLAPEERPVSVARLPLINRGLLAAALVILIGLPFAYFWKLDQAEQVQKSDVARLKLEAADLVEQRRIAMEAAAALNAFEAERSSPVRFLTVYEELAARLPGDTWLETIEYSGNRIRVTVLARESSTIIPVLEQAPQFASVSYSSSIIRDSRFDVDRFRLDITLEDGSTSANAPGSQAER